LVADVLGDYAREIRLNPLFFAYFLLIKKDIIQLCPYKLF
jgi:hypothetical protein